jgi:hypothetical protein
MPEKSHVEGQKDENDPDIHHQPFPKSVSEKREINSDYDGCHRQQVKPGSYLSAHR